MKTIFMILLVVSVERTDKNGIQEKCSRHCNVKDDLLKVL